MKPVTVLYNDVGLNPPPDDLDTVLQAQYVAKACGGRLVAFQKLSDLHKLPLEGIVFNLAEEYGGDGYNAYKIPAELERLKIPFTGCGGAAMKNTGDKVRAKKLMDAFQIPTAPYVTRSFSRGFQKGAYILKPARLSGSAGIDENSVVTVNTVKELRDKLYKTDPALQYFAERYIDGREISISLLELKRGCPPEILPPREMQFLNFGNRAKILDYASKWNTDSEIYKNTVSREITGEDGLAFLKEICLNAWEKFGLRGYARVDFRIDRDGNPFVLEINPNPCITPPDSSFVLAAKSHGLDFDAVVRILLDNAN